MPRTLFPDGLPPRQPSTENRIVNQVMMFSGCGGFILCCSLSFAVVYGVIKYFQQGH